ncbi:deoxyribonuclease [Clostridia bacterium]|nr:deoxyribonuclease [Clostridia bacterium]
MFVDTHTHYDDSRFSEDQEEMLSSLVKEGVDWLVNISANLRSAKTTLALTQRYPFVYGALGVHPDEVYTLDEEKISWIKEYLSDPKILAVGEIGLDYYREHDKNKQKYWFDYQLDLARQSKLPVVIHSRDAHQDTYAILKTNEAQDIGGVIHCFSYSKECAKQYLDLGFFLGIGGVLTFKNAKNLKEVVRYAPLEQLVLETDCPYLAPDPHRGERNDSRYLHYIAKAIAELKNLSVEDVCQVTSENAKRLYQRQG